MERIQDPESVELDVLGDVLLVERASSGAAFARRIDSPPNAGAALASFALTWEGISGRARLDLDHARGGNLTWTAYAQTEVGGHGLPVSTGHHFWQEDPEIGLAVETVLCVDPPTGGLWGWTSVTNASDSRVELASVSAFALGGLLAVRQHRAELLRCRNSWLAEHRWYSTPIAELLPDINTAIHRQQARHYIDSSGSGTWSTEHCFPGAYASESPHGRAIGWEVLPAGGWSWQLGERDGYAWLSLGGADDQHHNAARILEPGETHVSATGCLVAGEAGWQSANEALINLRRSRRRSHPDFAAPTLVYNDYLNTLLADPDQESVLALARAASKAGAEVYCVDAGWYDEARDGWWDSIGAWEEARSRFPDGLGWLHDRLGEMGLQLGLWLELESAGVRSSVAFDLPDTAFVRRGGKRLTVNGRYLLDLRSDAAGRHLRTVVDRLVQRPGARYFKLDCNVAPGNGLEDGDLAPGAALEDHARAYADWLQDVAGDYSSVVFENCASGGMRADGLLLSTAQLQSTSDQQDFALIPAIAVNAPASIPVEQCANWASVQPEMSPEEAAFTLVTGLAGRLYLSGHLDRLSDENAGLVDEAARFYLENRKLLSTTQCRWPTGLAKWADQWLTLLHVQPDGGGLLFVWSRSADAGHLTVRLDGFDASRVDTAFPKKLSPWGVTADESLITLTAGEGLQARVFRIHPAQLGGESPATS